MSMCSGALTSALKKGEICVLLGPSGSGKSTLLNIIGGIETPDSGKITIHGETIGEMNEKNLTLYRRKHLGYIFQMYNLIPNLNIKENVEVGAYLSDNPLDVDDLLKTLGLYRAPPQAAESAFRRTAAADGDRQSRCQESGHSAVRRADRCTGLPHFQGDPEAAGRCQPQVRQYSCHGYP